MTSYVLRLIARANGAEAVVRPQLTPAFGGRSEVDLGAGPPADAAQDDGYGIKRERAERARSIHTLPKPPSAAGPPTASQLAARLNRTLNPEADAPQTRGASNALETKPHEPPPPAQSPWPDDSGQPDHAAPTPASFSPPRPHVSPGESTGARYEAVHAASSSDDPVPACSPPVTFSSESDEGEPSAIVRIAIGRIEVRASVPRTTFAATGSRAAQPARRFAVSPKLTLEEYLNRRGRL